MKILITYLFNNRPLSEQTMSFVLLAFRIFCGAIMIPYGIGKIENFESYSVDFFGDPIGIGMMPSLILTIFAQVICAISLILGVSVRISAAILAFNMLIATIFHLPDPFATLSLPLLFLAIYIFLIFSGGGAYSIDNYIMRKNK